MLSGFVLLDKPSGMSSRGAGGRVARMFGTKKFGHVGTLDPMASGLLIIALGHATKIIPYLPDDIKEYEFSVKFGCETDTGDITGKITNQNDIMPTAEQLNQACKSLIGEYDQVPPMYSAVHIDGVRAYDLARKGENVEIPARLVKIFDLKNTEFPNKFLVKCGAGTYVRSLARDIAKSFGGIATCDSIRRTKTNSFDIKNAVALDFLENLYNNAGLDAIATHLQRIDLGLDDILVIDLNDAESELFKNGGFIPKFTENQESVRVYNNDEFIGIGIIKDNLLKPKRIIKD